MAKREIRPIRIQGYLAYVPLTQGHEAVIDVEDVPLVEGFNWRAMPHGRTVYAVRDETSGGVKKHVFMHQAIISTAAGSEIDHIDCDGLNNRRRNLRQATRAQNCMNQRTRSDNKSGFKGVQKRNSKWEARIWVSGKVERLGQFETAEDAHAAYCAAASRRHGKFARVS